MVKVRRTNCIHTAALMLQLAGVAVGSALEFQALETMTNRPVVLVSDPQATVRLQPQTARVQAMVERGITELTGAPDATSAWRTLANSNDTVAIKVYSSPGPNTGTRIPVVAAVVKGLLSACVLRTNILIWDRSEADLRAAGYARLAESLGIRLGGALQSGYDELDSYEFALVTGLRFGDLEFGRKDDGAGRRSFVTRLLGPNVTRIISIAPASNKHSTGVTGHLYSMTLGSVDNTWRFESNPSTLSWVLPEIYAMRSVGDRVVLCITDALICQYEGEEATLLHYSQVANELYFGTDPVALDLLAIQLLEQQRRSSDTGRPKPDLKTYQNAALLQLGTDDLRRVPIRRFSMDSGTALPASGAATDTPRVEP
ncbi:MAG: hypothetical protein MUE94_03370 [Verrucomicrobia bacterium]|jgi:hypothetical protein|nr:hypothetical protein [Verrucomicrobiota bacterium]